MKSKQKRKPKVKTEPYVKYFRGDGYRIVNPDGSKQIGTFYARAGAEMMLHGTFNSHAFTP